MSVHGNFRLTPERCIAIWRAVAVTFKDPRVYNPLKSNFAIRSVNIKGSDALNYKLGLFRRQYPTEGAFIIAVFAYFAYYVVDRGNTNNIHTVDPALVYDAYIKFTGRIESLQYDMAEFLKSIDTGDFTIDPATERPIICAMKEENRNFWHGDPVLMSVLCRFTTLNDVWSDGIKDHMKKNKNSRRALLTTILWCVIKRYCVVDSLAIQKVISAHL